MIGEFLFQVIEFLLDFINSWGYLGIFLGMVIESSFFPFPSEVILIPAGALIAQKEMVFGFVFLAALFGTLIGALINYFLAFYLGRRTINFLISKYGCFLFLNKENLYRSEVFFNKHGEITTFVGRLIPVFRQLISIPAGFLKMDIIRFCFFTSLGGGLWSLILIFVGYLFGSNLEWFEANKGVLTLFLLSFCLILIVFYLIFKKKKKL